MVAMECSFIERVSCSAPTDRPCGARCKRGRLTHDRRLRRNTPRALRPEIRRPAASVLRVVAGPLDVPLKTGGWGKQWLRQRWTIELGTEIDDEQAFFGRRVGKEPQHECVRAQHGSVHVPSALRPERRLVPSQPQQVLVERVPCAIGLALTKIQLAAREGLLVSRIVERGSGNEVTNTGKLREEFLTAMAHGS